MRTRVCAAKHQMLDPLKIRYGCMVWLVVIASGHRCLLATYIPAY